MKKYRVHRLFGGCRALPVLAAAAFCFAQTASSQIVVGMNGAGPLTFDTAPPASQFTYRSIAGGGNTFVDAAGVDAGVATNSASAITTALTTDTANPPGTSGNGRYNSTLDLIQTRPTGNGATIIMGTFSNGTPAEITEMTLGYDFNSFSPLSGHLPGHRVYYSLTGLENSWVPIPGLSDTETPGPLSATLILNWPANTLLYVLWFDDNADGISDPSYTIDNLSVSFPGQPPVIVQQPVGRTNN
jgi:hypothetical protein